MHDLKFAVKQIAKSPGFTAIAVLSLALGIGANTAIFSLVNAILLGSLPVPNPHELRTIEWSGTDADPKYVSGSFRPAGGEASAQRSICDAFPYPVYRSLREQVGAQADIFGSIQLRGVNVRARHEPFEADGLMVTDNFFTGLGVRPEIGRLFASGDDAAGVPPIAVIAHEWWEKEFGLSPDVVGRSVSLNGHAFTVIGVLPAGFHGIGLAERREFYVPMSAQPLLGAHWSLVSPDHWWVHLLARLRPGVDTPQLQASLDVLFAPQVEKVMKAPKIELGDGRAGLAYEKGYYRKPLLVLLGAVALVILVACANLAGLSLARSAARQHEFAVRAALGSGRWRLIRQSLVESLLLAIAGGVLGLLLASWCKDIIAVLFVGSTDGLRYDTSLDFTVLAFTLAASLLTAILSGFLPAWHAGRVDPLSGLKSNTALAAPRLKIGRILVIAQIALAVLLVSGAGLYVRTLVNLARIDPGFSTRNLLLFKLNLEGAGLHPGAEVNAFYENAVDTLARLPGVRDVALTSNQLLGGWMSGGNYFTLPAHPEVAESQFRAHQLIVSESFFRTMGIELRLGRGLTAADTENAPKVIVVNETFARKYFANENPLGQILKAKSAGGSEWTIVGVCGDAKYTNIKPEVPPTVYYPFRRASLRSMYVAARTSVPPLTIVGAARKAVAALNPNVPLAGITTQETVRDSNVSREKMFAVLVSALAALSVLLSGIGVFGLMAYNVTRRTREIGVRLALGAQTSDVSRPILVDALRLAGCGVAVGVPAALALARLVESQLYGVKPHDPLTLALGAFSLLALTALAAWLPARRAARVNPIEALRAE